jgi:hypothetical protein
LVVLTLGLWIGSDSAAVLVEGDVALWGAAQEWIDRRPRSDRFPSGAIDAALDAAGQHARHVSRVHVVVPAVDDPEGGPIARAARGASQALREHRRWIAALDALRAGGLQNATVQVVSAMAARAALGEAKCADRRLALAGALLGGAADPAPLVGALRGPAHDDGAIYRALGSLELPRVPVEDVAGEVEAARAEKRSVARYDGPTPFWPGAAPPGRLHLMRTGRPCPLVGVDGVLCHTPLDAARAWRDRRVAEIMFIGRYRLG